MFDLKQFRTARQLTQRQLADAMGMPLRTYEDLEAGRVELRPVHISAARYSAWQLRNPETVKGLPLKFFLVRFKQNGTWSEPWTVWALDFAQAVDRFYNMGAADLTTEVQIMLRPNEDGETYSHSEDHADAVLSHPDQQWPT